MNRSSPTVVCIASGYANHLKMYEKENVYTELRKVVVYFNFAVKHFFFITLYAKGGRVPNQVLFAQVKEMNLKSTCAKQIVFVQSFIIL